VNKVDIRILFELIYVYYTRRPGHEVEVHAGVRLLEVARQHLVQLSIQQQILHRNVQRSQDGLVFKAHRLLCHSTLGWRVIKKKQKTWVWGDGGLSLPLPSEEGTA